ncbi:MAG: 23S rRNA (adenine(2503)-C(2))-methyltransferase RlmN, partial [Thermomicrobia bacterium]|nr:23S rRNA (adenine(2503)-C(2))-methyltransferase RlmN [Thermomicrobia bacterium]MCA1723554.1 23S rRNA (adenine(2503)-C(2))-methyltransferase RlmN [Thermomicrobia bacterium]
MTVETTRETAPPAVPPGAQISLYDLLPEDLDGWLTAQGQPAFRAAQLYAGVYGRFAPSATAIPGVPKTLGALIDAALPLDILHEVTRQTSSDGRTTKLLLRTPDGCLIEGVLMHYRERATACISSQVGCGYGCTFCATGKMGLSRNLSAGEIVAQVIALARLSREQEQPLTNIVYMGMGEPLANYDQVMRSIAILNEPHCLKFGARRITVSTVGLAPRIRRLADEPWQVNLAVSLHQTTDEARSALMPVNRHYPITELLDAVRYYVTKTHRRVSFEYALIAGVNDTGRVANELSALLRGILCHVNLIPLNPVAEAVGPDGAPLARPTRESAEAFALMLTARGVPASVRYSR